MRYLPLLLAPALLLQAQSPQPKSPLARTYREGETLVYRMKGTNEDPSGTLRYEATATGTVQKRADGNLVECYAWSQVIHNGKPMLLPEASRTFRQTVSRSPGVFPAMPDLKGVSHLDGPVMDLLTFYADLFVATMAGLSKPGDHASFPVPQTNTFNFGPQVVVAEDAIDFDLTLVDVETATQTARLRVKHLPPTQAQVKLPAPWMKIPVKDTPNNWVQVLKAADGTFTAEVGQEFFEVEILLDLRDGKILRATMDNPIEVLRHLCADATLTPRGEGDRYRIFRRIEMDLITPLEKDRRLDATATK